MFAGAQYDRDWTWRPLRRRDGRETLRCKMMLMPVGMAGPQEIVTREGGLGWVKREP